METARETTTRGAEAFDALKPGWHRDVDLEGMNVNDATRCIGQRVFGSFGLTLGELNAHAGFERAKGICISPYDYGLSSQPGEERIVGNEWHTRVSERLLEDAMNDLLENVDSPVEVSLTV